MKIINVVIGIVLIAIGVFGFLIFENTILKYVVGIVAIVLGLGILILGFKSGGAAPVEGQGTLPAKPEAAPVAKI